MSLQFLELSYAILFSSFTKFISRSRAKFYEHYERCMHMTKYIFIYTVFIWASQIL